MNEASSPRGQIRRLAEGGYEGRLERHFEHGPDAVWSMLTEPWGLAQWLAPGSIELCAGGRVHINFADSGSTIDSTVLELDPPRLLAYSWSAGDEPVRPLHWQLGEDGTATHLVLTVRLPPGDDAAKACAGFEAHLDMLAAALEGIPIRFPFDRYREARRFYQGLLQES